MSAQEIINSLSKRLQNRRCYTMGTILSGKDADAVDAGIVKRTYDNRFLNAMRRENHTLVQSEAGAIGELSNLVIEAATPDAVGRELAKVVETTKSSVKFRKRKLATANDTSSSRTTDSVGDHPDFVDVPTNIEIESSEEWSQSFLEDAEWDVIREEAEAIGVALKQKETTKIIAKFENITATSLAGGSQLNSATGGTLAYNDVVTLWSTVKNANRNPTKLVINPLKMGDLLKDQVFINSLMFGDFVDKTRGVFGRSPLGFDVVVSSLVASNRAYMIDTNVALAMPIRRDSVVTPYDARGNAEAGVKATSRFGLEILAADGVARMAI